MTTELKCGCGQTTEILKRDGAYYYAPRHGTDRKYNGCINCHKYLPTPDDEAAEKARLQAAEKAKAEKAKAKAKAEKEKASAKSPHPGPDEYEGMNFNQLRQLAANRKLNIGGNAKKAELIEALIAADAVADFPE